MHPKAPSRLAHLPVIVASSALHRHPSYSDVSGPIFLVPAEAISADAHGWPVYDVDHPDTVVIGTWTREDCLMHVGAGAKIHYGTHDVHRFTNTETIQHWVPGERFASVLCPDTVTTTEPMNRCGAHASRRTRWGYSDGSRNRNRALPTPEPRPLAFRDHPPQNYTVDCAKCLALPTP